MSSKVDWEGTRRLTTVYQPHEDRLYVQQDSHQIEAEIAQRNAQMRQVEQSGKGPVRLMLTMSDQDLEQLTRKYPDLLTGSAARRRELAFRIARERPELVAMEFKPRLHPVTQAMRGKR